MIENNRYYWSHLKTKTVTVRVKQTAESTGVVFRVSNLIDIGNGRQTVILDHVDFPQTNYRRPKKDGLAIPFRMGSLDFVYTSRQNPSVQNISNLLACLYKGARVEKIVPDVLCPGDLLVFKQQEKSMKIKMVDALRIVKENTYTESKAGYAL
jgi:hypothetical protein